jgi:hypothetical protein
VGPEDAAVADVERGQQALVGADEGDAVHGADGGEDLSGEVLGLPPDGSRVRIEPEHLGDVGRKVRGRVADVRHDDERAVDERGRADVAAEDAARRERRLPDDRARLPIERVIDARLVARADERAALRAPQVR